MKGVHVLSREGSVNKRNGMSDSYKAPEPCGDFWYLLCLNLFNFFMY